MSEVYGVPYFEVGRLRIDEFEVMVRELSKRAQRNQLPITQLTWRVAGALGNKSALEDWYVGWAREEVKHVTQNPGHLERALQIGLKLGKVSEQAFITLRQVRG